MEEEPLSDWAERRSRRRADRYRVVTLTPGPPAGGHVDPAAPRLVSRWNGYEWEAVAVVANLAEAKRILYPETAGTDPTPCPPAVGRHGRAAQERGEGS
ncbi:DUF6087 family protein [Streptomyces sp. NPDC127098]|uniref:DUF6087 family protein n=1 Tax=Streptomyces sp. NPDC127098 TaxID=3347137 RepID=UPI00365404C2